ncbi:hypothetical protein HYQ40_02360 [Aerococcaceae bacterium DSM 111021]|nr:hypothetical protein [Aerococcaceae bacterium DSM 111021]
MKRKIIILGLLNLIVVQSVQAQEQTERASVPRDLATQIMEGEFSDESKESIYNKVKDVLDIVVDSIEFGDNLEGIIGVDVIIDQFGEDYTYTENLLNYDFWVGVDTFKMTVSMNEENNVEYLYGNLNPTFEAAETTESESDLVKVREFIEKPHNLPSFEEVNEHYASYNFEFIQDEMTYIDGTQSMTYDWATKDLIKLEIGQANYGRASLNVTQVDIDELNQIEDLNIQGVIDVVGDKWVYVYNLKENTKEFIWEDPLGGNVTVDVTDELLVNKIETLKLNE